MARAGTARCRKCAEQPQRGGFLAQAGLSVEPGL